MGSVRLALLLMAWALALGCVGSGLGKNEHTATCTPAPRLEGTPPGQAEVGRIYSAVFTGEYNCGWSVCFSLDPVRLPQGASIDNSVKAVFWTPVPAQANTTQTLAVRTPADACGNAVSFTWDVAVAPAPELVSFTASPPSVAPGGTTQLTAVFLNASAGIENLGPIQSGVPVTTPPLSVGTGFTLHVVSPLGTELVRSLVVPVVAPPASSIRP